MDGSETLDTDGDLIGNNADLDDDGDTWNDTAETVCGSDPLLNSSVPIDLDGDHLCDVMDSDDDGDTIPDINDVCRGHDDTLDYDDDGTPDGCDVDMDMDGDGLSNANDMCDFTPLEEIGQIDEYGCGPSEAGDDDFDGVPNSVDICADTPPDEAPNPSGCGASQRDTDGDGVKDLDEIACGSNPVDSSDIPDASCLGESQQDDTSSDSNLMDLSCWIFLIIFLLIILALAMILSSSRNEEGKIVFSVNTFTSSVKRWTGNEDDDDGDDMYSGESPIQESKALVDVDSWDAEPAAYVPPTDEVDEAAEKAEEERKARQEAADAKMAEMDAKMDEKMAQLSELDAKMDEKADQLARIAAKAESIDFATIGTASADQKSDLQSIKGVGPFIEEKLNALQIFTFEQIANMTPEIEDQVNEAIEFFPGRIKRDKWVNQATELADPQEETEGEPVPSADEDFPDIMELLEDDDDDLFD